MYTLDIKMSSRKGIANLAAALDTAERLDLDLH